jgi:hypoxanthine phosphoribosyltransferase
MMAPLDCVFTSAQIDARVRDIARRIQLDCQGAPIVLLVVLKGAIMLAADLVRQLPGNVLIDFFVVSSYATDGQPAGELKVLHAPRTDLTGRHVILVDEIIDTGQTVVALLDRYINGRGAASVRVCTLLDKVAARLVPVTIDYVGFEAPDRWLIGYGMDNDDGFGRNLPGVFAVPIAESGGGADAHQ